MEQGKRKMAGALLAAAALSSLAAGRVEAISFAEPGDAGQTLATAAPTGTNTTTPLNTITGTVGTSTDADLFILTITNTTTFSAVASSAAGIDTSLFLFSATGAPILANDDQSGTNYQAALPAGNSLLTTIAAGTYYLGISLSGNEAVNSANQQLFTVDQPTTNVRGAASGLNPATLAGFNGQTFYAETGTYSIALTGANTSPAVPEPSTWALLAGALTATTATARRRQRAAR